MTIRKGVTIQEDVLRLRMENEALRRIITDLHREIGELKRGNPVNELSTGETVSLKTRADCQNVHFVYRDCWGMPEASNAVKCYEATRCSSCPQYWRGNSSEK